MEIIKTVDLHKSYGDLHVLVGVNETIHKGEVVSIIGPSGGGKSTFLRCLNLLEKPEKGQIFFNGEDISGKNVNIDAHRQKMGMVFQQFNVFPHLTVAENITMAPRMLKGMSQADADNLAKELLARVGLLDKYNEMPGKLSGGQKQRVAIAGVLAMKPDVIILDESTAMLDPSGRAEVMNTVHRLNREEGISVVIITHYMSEAATADYVIVMDEGKIAMSGTPREVFTKVDAVRKLGLDVPPMTDLAHMLREKGLDVRADVLTVDEMVEEVCRLSSNI